MKIFIFWVSIIICLLGVSKVYAFDTGQQIFRSNVRTLSVYNPDNFMASPVVRLNSYDKLVINFDVIGNQHEYFRYRLIHCNSDWQPSRLLESEYINGFNEFEIEDYAYSANTYIHYVNYNIVFSAIDAKLLASGNYLLQVFPENNPDDVILQVRFSVSEERTFVEGGITTRTDKGSDSYFQQLFLSVDVGSLGNINPYQDLIIEITQNNQPYTSKKISHPLRVESGKAIFEHSPELIFDAGNEYRRFETVRTDYPGMHVDSVKFYNGMWNAWLQPDFNRKDKEYVYDMTQRGRFKVDEYNSSDPDLSADYVMTHFSLNPEIKVAGKVYIDGDFTNHTFSDQNLMKYNLNTGEYEASIPLKQGSYNYRYVVVDEKGIPSPSLIEGNKYETNNEYLIKVFLRTPGSRADRLVSTGTFSFF